MHVIGLIGTSALREHDVVDALILSLRFEGLSVSTIKRAPDGFDADQPGKLSYRRREAGTREVMLVGGERLALMSEFRGDPQPSLDQLVTRLLPVDVVIAEGFKGAAIPTVEVFVAARHGEPRVHRDPNIIAVITDNAIDCAVPRFRSDDIDGLCRLLVEHLSLAPASLQHPPTRP